MGERVGFVTRGEAGSTDWEAPTLGMGMLGHAFMGKAHTNAYKTLDYIYTSLPAHPRLVAIAGRDKERVEAAARLGLELESLSQAAIGGIESFSSSRTCFSPYPSR